MDIYSILSSKPHNPHYLNRYITFIRNCQQKNNSCIGYTEKHHICPKARDMFPEYKSLTKHEWNEAKLTPRQHFVSHILLWKIFPGTSQEDALWAMKHKNGQDINSRLYESLRNDIRKKNIDRTRLLSNNGIHPWQGNKNPSKRKIEEGTHIFLSDDHPMKIKSKNGTHPWLGPETNAKYAKENARKRIESGSYSKIAKEQNRKRVESGVHHLLGPDVNKRRVENGTHNLIGKVPCVDRNGKRINVSKDVYSNQNGNKDSWEFVHFNSFEGRRRKATS